MRRVAGQVASKKASPPQGAEQKQASPVRVAAADCPAAQQAAVREQDAPKQSRSRPKLKQRKPAKRSKIAAADERSRKQGVSVVPYEADFF